MFFVSPLELDFNDKTSYFLDEGGVLERVKVVQEDGKAAIFNQSLSISMF